MKKSFLLATVAGSLLFMPASHAEIKIYEAVNRDSNNAEAYDDRDECYKARGDIKKSQEDFVKAKQLGWEN